MVSVCGTELFSVLRACSASYVDICTAINLSIKTLVNRLSPLMTNVRNLTSVILCIHHEHRTRFLYSLQGTSLAKLDANAACLG